jgi:hypothetical protein
LNASGFETEQDAVKKVTELWAAYNNALPLGTVCVGNEFVIYLHINILYDFIRQNIGKD